MTSTQAGNWRPMYCEIDSFRIGDFKFEIGYDSGGEVGGEISADVSDGLGQHLLQRTFYFGGQDRHIRAFARKFAEDADYRQACLEGTVKWARLNRWYSQNAAVYVPQIQTVWCASTPEEERALEEAVGETESQMERLYDLLRHQLNELESLPAYQEHLAAERESPDASMGALDADIERAVLLLNGIPGVATRFSCQGIRRCVAVDWWQHGPIWFPAKHMPFAHVQFAEIPPEMEAKLDAFLRCREVGKCRFKRAVADAPEHNVGFVQALEDFAGPRSTGEVPLEAIVSSREQRTVSTQPWPTEVRQAAIWHFGSEAQEARTLWDNLPRDEQLSVARAFLAWKDQARRQSPRVAIDLLVRACSFGLRPEWRKGKRRGQRYGYLVFCVRGSRRVKWQIAPYEAKRTGKLTGLALYHHNYLRTDSASFTA
jgi:hypothetical protein